MNANGANWVAGFLELPQPGKISEQRPLHIVHSWLNAFALPLIILRMSVAQNIARLRERVAKAAKRASADPASITLMAVSKTVEPERIRQAYETGIRVFGENRVQEFEEKSGALATLTEARWRLIGHLQTNKARKAAELFHAVDSVDSLRLAEKLNQAAAQLNRMLPVLIEIKTGDEQSKSGIPAALPGPGPGPELEELLQGMARLEHLQVQGLMTVPPFSEDPESARPYFRRLRELRDSIAALGLPNIRMETLSMGMSHDFEVAIEEGSNCVRVGTALFGARS
jgi:pyridoxal phosphate enzyme (YggS family)